ncbi:MAG: 4-hydroxythreonine-4-phosphate dehydrogenase PdxA [Odoribacter sp.]
MENRLIVGITQGDVNGIGYELIIKMMAENKICEVCTPVLFGSSKVAAYHRKALNVENFSLNSIQRAQEANAKRCNVINCVDDAIKVDLGQETPESDEASMIALNAALESLDRKEVDVVVGAPQGCNSFQPFLSCPSFMADRYDARNIMPLLVGVKMKMGFVTSHLPFKDVPENITVANVYNKLRLLDDCLRKDFTIRKPRIAVLGLNPHAGENGLYGQEEKEIIVPAIEKARNSGVMALGPYAPDSLFGGVDFEKFDVILAMYHDQGMTPFKAIEGNDGAVLLAGLPIVYTSTVHGMAYDITGQGIGDESAMRNAVYLAIDVYNNRQMNAELAENPLKHYDIASNSNESDLNVEQIAGVQREVE